MKNVPCLQAAPYRVKNVASVPKKEPDPFDKVLAAFAREDRSGEPTVEDLDALYSAAVSEGLLSETELREAFDRLMARRIETNDERELMLVPNDAPLVGQILRAVRERRALGVDEVATECNLTTEQICALEESTVVFDTEQTVEIARALAVSVKAPVARVNTLLQRVVATVGARSAHGPVLMAARKLKPK